MVQLTGNVNSFWLLVGYLQQLSIFSTFVFNLLTCCKNFKIASNRIATKRIVHMSSCSLTSTVIAFFWSPRSNYSPFSSCLASPVLAQLPVVQSRHQALTLPTIFLPLSSPVSCSPSENTSTKNDDWFSACVCWMVIYSSSGSILKNFRNHRCMLSYIYLMQLQLEVLMINLLQLHCKILTSCWSFRSSISFTSLVIGLNHRSKKFCFSMANL